jgi:flagellar protein FlaG
MKTGQLSSVNWEYPLHPVHERISERAGNDITAQKASMEKNSKFIRKEDVSRYIEDTNKKLEHNDMIFQYSVHEETHQIMIKVINKQTQEVIREIPPEKILDIVANLWKIAGLIIDEKR